MMSGFRILFILAVIGVTTSGCMERRLAVSLNEDGLPSFLTADQSSLVIKLLHISI